MSDLEQQDIKVINKSNDRVTENILVKIFLLENVDNTANENCSSIQTSFEHRSADCSKTTTKTPSI